MRWLHLYSPLRAPQPDFHWPTNRPVDESILYCRVYDLDVWLSVFLAVGEAAIPGRSVYQMPCGPLPLSLSFRLVFCLFRCGSSSTTLTFCFSDQPARELGAIVCSTATSLRSYGFMDTFKESTLLQH